MSRLIVKNLPHGIKEDRFRSMFFAFGTLTDCSLKFTKDGKFRKFGFVGFKSEEDAERALKHFNKSFVDTSRVTVEWCKSFGDTSKAKAWSKHSCQPETSKQQQETHSKKQQGAKEKKTKQSASTSVGELEQDQGFQEFLAVHQNRAQVPTWTNDSLVKAGDKDGAKDEKKRKKKNKPVNDDYLNFDSDESESEDQSQDEDQEEDDESSQSFAKEALKADLSDMEYLRCKMVNTKDLSEKAESQGEDSDGDGAVMDREKSAVSKHTDSAYESGDRDAGQTAQSKGEVKVKSSKTDKKQETEPTTDFTVKLRGAPFNVKEQQVREFMTPLKPAAIRIVKNQFGNKTGYVFVDLHSEEEVVQALRKNKDYMGGRYIEVFRATAVNKEPRQEKEGSQLGSFQRSLKEDEEQEDLSESGRLFIRNLPYTCSEQELSDVFSKYGPLSEIHLPIDDLTKKPKGFAFITYMIPEDAVRALAEMDGHVFQGRMLHILPSIIKKEASESGPDGPGASSYKKQRDTKQKASSASSYNWNTLFLGTSSVADVIAEKYNTTKSQVLDHESAGSLAVRMALGETQIVQETRQFLLDNHVSLDSFSQASGPRSNVVLLVKNLPAGVQVAELEELFSRYGSLGRVLLPPSGLTAIVEFLEPTEAKKAFLKLAYTKFQHVPLYLEWAPMEVFSKPLSENIAKPPVEDTPVPETQNQNKDAEEGSDEEEENLPGCTIFIKNLNFSTSEEALAGVFSKCGPVKSCTISKKQQKSGELLSMGYGFVEYRTPEAANKALRQLQHCQVDEHQLELKLSTRVTRPAVASTRTKQVAKKQTSSKILVRNIPFQATASELRELFGTFGELKTVRLPKKMSGTGSHRGFGFVDFLTKQDAKRAFSTLCHSTHLYGRRLVLEWADTEETVETLRRKTAQHFHDVPKKRKKSEVMEGMLGSLEGEEEVE